MFLYVNLKRFLQCGHEAISPLYARDSFPVCLMKFLHDIISLIYDMVDENIRVGYQETSVGPIFAQNLEHESLMLLLMKFCLCLYGCISLIPSCCSKLQNNTWEDPSGQ